MALRELGLQRLPRFFRSLRISTQNTLTWRKLPRSAKPYSLNDHCRLNFAISSFLEGEGEVGLKLSYILRESRTRKDSVEIFHHFGIRVRDGKAQPEFHAIGLDLQFGKTGSLRPIAGSLEISESDERWEGAQQLIEKYKLTDFVFTRFSEQEQDAAEVLGIFAKSQHGYPQPEAKFGYLAATYSLSEYCEKCGIGLKQVQPFRIKSNSRLALKMMQLNWVFDEFFIGRDVWASIFEPVGIGCWPVILHKTGDVAENVVQLRIVDEANISIQTEVLADCTCCGRTKSGLVTRGFSPVPDIIPAPIFKSTQYFGAGANAFHRVYVSAALYRAIKKCGLRGVEFYPCPPGEPHLKTEN